MPPTRPPVGTGRGMVKSHSTNDREEESVYHTVVGHQVAPKVRVYAAAPTSPTGGPVPKARMHADSSQVSSIINPVSGTRDAMIRQGIKPTDHARSNAMAIKEQSQMNALRKQQAAELEQLQGGRPGLARSNSLPLRQPSPSPGAQPTRGSGNASRNFVAENRIGAAAPIRPTQSKEDDSLKYLNKRDYGRVPTYLLERKLEMAEAAAQAERDKEAAMVPPGMRLLPEEERLETLSILTRNKADVERALQGLPLRIETPSQIRHKNELEQRLREIEDATKVFSRPKVLVHL